MVYRVVWRVGSHEALGFWADPLQAEGVTVERGESSLLFADPEGLQHQLVVDESGEPPSRPTIRRSGRAGAVRLRGRPATATGRS